VWACSPSTRARSPTCPCLLFATLGQRKKTNKGYSTSSGFCRRGLFVGAKEPLELAAALVCLVVPWLLVFVGSSGSNRPASSPSVVLFTIDEKQNEVGEKKGPINYFYRGEAPAPAAAAAAATASAVRSFGMSTATDTFSTKSVGV